MLPASKLVARLYELVKLALGNMDGQLGVKINAALIKKQFLSRYANITISILQQCK